MSIGASMLAAAFLAVHNQSPALGPSIGLSANPTSRSPLHCGLIEESTVSICVNARFTDLPRQPYTQVFSLLVRNSTFPTVTTATLSKFPNLQYVDFINATVSSIEENSFQNLPILRTVVFMQNHLARIPKNVLEGTSVTEIIIADNPNLIMDQDGEPFLISIKVTLLGIIRCNISSLNALMFSQLPNLTLLYLTGNRLNILPNDLFKYQHRLGLLDLSHNSLTTLPSLLYPQSRISINCSRNPWDCKNDMQLLGSTLSNRNIIC